jgi:hypothetical protein
VPTGPAFVCGEALQFFCDDLLQNASIQPKIGPPPIELAVLFFSKLAQLTQVADLQAGKLLLQTK